MLLGTKRRIRGKNTETVLGQSKQFNIINDIGGNINIKQPNILRETESNIKINAPIYTGKLIHIQVILHCLDVDQCEYYKNRFETKSSWAEC